MTALRSAAPGNDWRSLSPRGIGEPAASPTSVTVVMPAHECQAELDLSLAALAHQSHPADLLDVIVVDDRSEPPLVLPELAPKRSRIIRVDGGGHGSGRARDIGAREADGEVVLFLDADIIADRTHVEAHVRWHEVTDDAVVLGFRDFVDTSGIDATEVASAVARGDLASLVEGREREPHSWIEKVLADSDDLCTDRDDLWRVVVGASVSTRRTLYASIGGFAHFQRRGIVDTEFGYRCFTGGGLIIPERAAYSLHQGQRSFATRGEELARRRAPLIANHIASPRYRTPIGGRQWAVPFIGVIVPAGSADFTMARRTVDDLLANDFDDLKVTVVVDPDGQDSDLYHDYWSAEGRVHLTDTAPESGFPSPATLYVPVGTRLAPTTVTTLVETFREWTHGLVSASVTGIDEPVELWATRSLTRSVRAAGTTGSGARETVRRLFGEQWLAGGDVGMGTARGASDRHFSAGRFYAGRKVKTAERS